MSWIKFLQPKGWLKPYRNFVGRFYKKACKYRKYGLLALLFTFSAWLFFQVTGCNEINFAFQPMTCSDFDTKILLDAECIEAEGPGGGSSGTEVDGGGGDPADGSSPSGGRSGLPTFGDGSGEGRLGNTFGDAVEGAEGRNKGLVYKYKVQLGQVDIIFVIDNSHSMYEEQQSIAGQFNRFLKKIKDLDYRIALMTVDILNSPGNKRRPYQNGRFIKLDGNIVYLQNEEQNSRDRRRKNNENIRLFREAIESLGQDTTLACDEDTSACPDDERAICALNMSLYVSETRQSSFFRPTGHLMVIILSDEDERSSEEFILQMEDRGDYSYALTSCDDPTKFYHSVSQRISTIKTISGHSIIIPPDDSSCLSEQNAGSSKGYYGEKYEEFALPSQTVRNQYPNVLRGQVLSICENNYGRQLGQLSEYLSEPQPFRLPCNPENVRLTLDRENIEYTLNGREVSITQRVPLNARIRVHVECQPGIL